MKKSLYDILQVSKIADQDVIEVAYQRLIQKTQADGSPDSQNQAKFIQHAYEVLNNQAQRALYDKSLQNQDNLLRNAAFQPSQYKSDFADVSDGWWKSPKITGIIVAILALIGFSLFTGHTGEKNKVEIVKQYEATKSQANELSAANVSKHLDNEETLVNGVVESKYKYIDESAKKNNRVIDVAQQAESTRRAELEYRANVESQRLEMARREQDARLEMQRKQQASNEQRAKDQTAENARRYYSCINAAIDRYGASQAQSMCQRN